jgi:hypothetical protein
VDDQVGGLLQEGAPPPQPAHAERIEVDPAVDAAVAEVTVERGPVVVAVQQRVEVAQVLAEALRWHGGVLPSLPVVALAEPVRGRG